MSYVILECWRNRVLRENKERAARQSDVEVLLAHDAEMISSRKAQHKLGQQVNPVRCHRYVASLDQLLEAAGPFGFD